MTILSPQPLAGRVTPSRVRGAAPLLAVGLALLATLLPAAPAHAASSIDIQVRALVGGRYEVGGWAAISVTLVNDGEPSQGNLSAETDGGTVQRFVEMPAGARKVVTLYVQPEAFQRRVTVRYEEPNGTVQGEVEVRVLEQSGALVAIVGDGAGSIRTQIAAGLDESAPEPLTLVPADIPERPEPLSGIAALVWAADSSGLTEAQRHSIERWVADGGELLVVGGADWQARTEAFSHLLPMTELAAFDGVPQESLMQWAASTAPAVASETVSAGPLHPEARALVVAGDGTVLLSMRPVGGGRTILIGADVATEAYRAWDGSPRVWSRLITTGVNLEGFFGPGIPRQEELLNTMSQALSNLPSLDVPPAELLLAVIVAYILLIGPISYVVLRRLDRREAAWITAPLLVVVFSACSYGIGNTMKGSDVITNQIALIHTSSAGGAATVQSFMGIFSPERASYDTRVEADALMAPLDPASFFAPGQSSSSEVVVEQGNPARVRGLSIGVFGFKAVRADAIVDYEPVLSVTWAWDEEGRLNGLVTNNGEAAIEDVAYISSSVAEMVGDLGPGEQGEFRVPGRNFNGSPASDQVYGFGGFDVSDPDQREVLTRRQVIDALVGYGGFGEIPAGASFGQRGPYLIGWRGEVSPLSVELEGVETQRYTHAVEVLSVRHPLGTGEVEIRPAQMSVSVIATEGDTSSGGPGMMFVGSGSVTYGITLPLEATGMAVDSVEVVVGPDPYMVLTDQGQFGGGFFPPGYTAELRNPVTGEWQLLGDLADKSTFAVEDPATAISAGGRLEVRITGPEEVNANFGQASVFVSAEVVGVIAP